MYDDDDGPSRPAVAPPLVWPQGRPLLIVRGPSVPKRLSCLEPAARIVGPNVRVLRGRNGRMEGQEVFDRDWRFPCDLSATYSLSPW